MYHFRTYALNPHPRAVSIVSAENVLTTTKAKTAEKRANQVHNWSFAYWWQRKKHRATPHITMRPRAVPVTKDNTELSQDSIDIRSSISAPAKFRIISTTEVKYVSRRGFVGFVGFIYFLCVLYCMQYI